MTNQNSPWELLSSETAQVLFCDLQKVIVQHSKTTTPQALSSSAGALLQLARIFSLPTIMSVVPDGTDHVELIEELANADGLATKLQRTTNSLFADATTRQAIEQNRRKVLIIAGFMMEAVVLDTVLDARSAGYQVLVAVDACGSPSPRTEQAVLRQMESAGAVPTSVVSIGTKLSPDFATELGKQMFSLVQSIHYV